MTPPSPPPDVAVKVVADRLRVWINDTLHLSIDLAQLVAIQSYKYGDYRFAIDYTLKTTLVETWYVERETWTAVLHGLEKVSLL